MLADDHLDVRSGGLDRNIHLPATAKVALVAFIASELPVWRDHPDRPRGQAETILTEHVCDHLNSAASKSGIWSHIQFRTETGDETACVRKIDLSAKPRGAVLFLEGRRHSQFDALFPIECKRLPTPSGTDRDEREYVVTKYKSTGGIQRFKYGNHGSSHSFGAMIAYIQAKDAKYWLDKVNQWITDLTTSTSSIWASSDALELVNNDSATGVSNLKSEHCRDGSLGAIHIRHVWIKM